MSPAVAVQAHAGVLPYVGDGPSVRPWAGTPLMPPGRGGRIVASGPGAQPEAL